MFFPGFGFFGQSTGVPFHRLITSVPVLLSVDSDTVVLNGSTVSQWTDLTGNGNHLIQAVAGAQPTYNATGLNGHGTLAFDGTSDYLACAGLNLPAPGTTPTFMWGVFRQDGWTLNRQCISTATSTSMLLFQATATPGLSIRNTTIGPVNNAAAVASWVRFEASYTNSVADYLKLAATSVTGTNTGNTDPAAGLNLCTNTAVTVFAQMTWAAFMVIGGTPSAGELSALSAAVTAKYGGSVGV